VLKETTPARVAPRRSGARYGLIARGTRVAWRAVLPGDAGCPRWIEVLPMGHVCEDEVVPSPEPPTTEDLPRLRSGQIVPDRFDPREVSAPDRVLTTDLVADEHTRRCEARPAWRPGKHREREEVSDFSGFRLDCPDAPALPFAWAQSHRGPSLPVPLRAEPRTSAPVSGQLAPRTVLPLTEPLARQGAFVHLAGQGWVLGRDLRVARATPPPAGVGSDERWIDVDVAEQVLIAMEGPRPVYATLVATGMADTRTPLGLWRVLIKRTVALMRGVDYRVQVPWTMYLDDYYALHSAYWHDRYGNPTSHGCVNIAPIDARVLFHWAGPPVPPGWASVRGTPVNPGTLVRIHDGPRFHVPLRGYAAEAR